MQRRNDGEERGFCCIVHLQTMVSPGEKVAPVEGLTHEMPVVSALDVSVTDGTARVNGKRRQRRESNKERKSERRIPDSTTG